MYGRMAGLRRRSSKVVNYELRVAVEDRERERPVGLDDEHVEPESGLERSKLVGRHLVELRERGGSFGDAHRAVTIVHGHCRVFHRFQECVLAGGDLTPTPYFHA